MSKKVRRKRRKAWFQRWAPPGAPPGTLTVDPSAPRPVIRVLAYGPDRFVEQELPAPEDAAAFLEKWPVTWVSVVGLGDAQILGRLAAVFDLHPLAMEDVVHVHQRAKSERYAQQHFIVARIPAAGNGTPANGLETEQLSCFLGKNYVVSFQQHPVPCVDILRERIRQAVGQIRHVGADHLAYALLDTVADAYFPLLEECGERLDALEDEILVRTHPSIASRLHAIRRDLLAFRRAIWPLRDGVNSLLGDPTHLITEETRFYLRDCYDHTIQLIDLLEMYRDLSSSLMDIYLSRINNRMNEIMKVLAMIATIFIPLTFIAGLYGMNFDTSRSPLNMPELTWRWGYPFCLALMAVVAGGTLLLFRRQGWLGSDSGAGEPGAGEPGARPGEEEGKDRMVTDA